MNIKWKVNVKVKSLLWTHLTTVKYLHFSETDLLHSVHNSIGVVTGRFQNLDWKCPIKNASKWFQKWRYLNIPYNTRAWKLFKYLLCLLTKRCSCLTILKYSLKVVQSSLRPFYTFGCHPGWSTHIDRHTDVPITDLVFTRFAYFD